MEPKFVDVHAHLSDHAFDGNEDMFALMEDGYIVLNSGENHSDNLRVIELNKKYPNILPCVGLHPNYLSNLGKEEVDREISDVTKDVEAAFAVSEIGLDYKNKDRAQISGQKRIFRTMLELSEKFGKPCIVHSRKAMDDVLDIVSSFKTKVVLHNFEGNLSHLSRAAELGLGVSISTGFIKFKKDNVVKKAGIDSLFVETDSPVLSPDQNTNTPLNLKVILEYISDIRGMEFNVLKDTVYNNFERFFYD